MNNGTRKFFRDYGKAFKYVTASGLLLGPDAYYSLVVKGLHFNVGEAALPLLTAFIGAGLGAGCVGSVKETYKTRKAEKSERKEIEDLVQATR